MGKHIIPFGFSKTDALVKEWLEKKGVSPNDVMAYRITRADRDVPRIELTMFFDEPEEEVTTDGLPS